MRASENRDLFYIKIFAGVLVFVFCIVALRELKQIFLPFTIALLLYFLFHDFVCRLVAWRVPRALVLLLLLALLFVVLYVFTVLIYSGAASFIENFPLYSDKFSQLVQGLLLKLKIPLSSFNQYLAQVDWNSILNPGQLTAMISSTMGSFSSFLGYLVLVLLLLMFMLAPRIPLGERLSKTISRRRTVEFREISQSIETDVRRYLLIKTLMSVATALLGALILQVGGIDFVLFSTFLIFLLNYIPTFGSVVSTLFPVIIGVLEYGFSLRVLLVALGLMAMQFVMGNVVEPLITGRSLNLSPVVILISLIFWGWVWGVVGMFLAVPLTSAMKIIFEHVDMLKPLAAAMSSE